MNKPVIQGENRQGHQPSPNDTLLNNIGEAEEKKEWLEWFFDGGGGDGGEVKLGGRA